MPSELRPSADLSSWASATPAENSANLQRAARWCGAKAAPQANTRNLGSLSWWGSDRRGHGQTAWHGAHHHGQRQHRAPTAGAGVGNALLRNAAELLTWCHCPTTTTSASAIKRCCAALTRGSLFFLLVFLLVLFAKTELLQREIRFRQPLNESPSTVCSWRAFSICKHQACTFRRMDVTSQPLLRKWDCSAGISCRILAAAALLFTKMHHVCPSIGPACTLARSGAGISGATQRKRSLESRVSAASLASMGDSSEACCSDTA